MGMETFCVLVGGSEITQYMYLSKPSQQYSEKGFIVCKLYFNLRKPFWMFSQISNKEKSRMGGGAKRLGRIMCSYSRYSWKNWEKEKKRSDLFKITETWGLRQE